MLSALISFFGGSVFRMLWGEISSLLKDGQDHKQEVERMRVQAEIDAAQHTRNLEAIRVQAELGVKTIQVQAEQNANSIELSAWADVVKSATATTGIKFIDIWNGSIRPLLATIVICVWTLSLYRQGFVFTDWDRDLAGAILGIFIADRILVRRSR